MSCGYFLRQPTIAYHTRGTEIAAAPCTSQCAECSCGSCSAESWFRTVFFFRSPASSSQQESQQPCAHRGRVVLQQLRDIVHRRQAHAQAATLQRWPRALFPTSSTSSDFWLGRHLRARLSSIVEEMTTVSCILQHSVTRLHSCASPVTGELARGWCSRPSI